MRPSPIAQLRADVEELEVELTSLNARTKLDANAQRRLGEIQEALPRLRSEVQRLLQAAKPGA